MSDRVIGYPVINIATPHDKLLCWTAGQDRQNVARLASDYNITYIPVRENGRITGLVTRASLGSDPEPVIQPLTADWLIAADTPILKVIELFAANPDRVFLVLQASDIVGLVAPADLNKTPARASVYLLLAEFEMALGKLIRRVLPYEENYCKHLTAQRLGKARDKKREASPHNMDLDLLGCMFIEDLTTIAQKDKQIRDLLEFRSKGHAESFMSLKTVRNAVSHPVGPLVSSRRRLSDVHDVCHRLIDLNKRIGLANSKLDQAAGTDS